MNRDGESFGIAHPLCPMEMCQGGSHQVLILMICWHQLLIANSQSPLAFPYSLTCNQPQLRGV
jgi:hypothetical protein